MRDVGDHEDLLREHDRKITAQDRDIQGLKQVIDVKLDKITGDINDLRNILKWAGGLIVSLMLSFMAWALLQQWNANEAAKSQLQNQVQELQQQQSRQQQIRQSQERIEESLSPSGTAQSTPRAESSR